MFNSITKNILKINTWLCILYSDQYNMIFRLNKILYEYSSQKLKDYFTDLHNVLIYPITFFLILVI